MKYDYIFVVLTYRNIDDLNDFFYHFNVEKSKVIVVNSFYDETSNLQFKKIAERNNSDFLSVPNNGYGAGNNRGIEYAMNKYEFYYLVVSNADIIIEKYLSASELPKGPTIIAPDIRNVRGKRQNPHIWKVNKLLYNAYYFDAFHNWRIIPLLCRIYTRLTRELFGIISELFPVKCRKIDSAHGSNVIFSYDALSLMKPLYNERQFLFAEEEHIANLSKINNVKIYYMRDIKVLHKEDGSMKITNASLNEIGRKSFMEFYRFWYKNK